MQKATSSSRNPCTNAVSTGWSPGSTFAMSEQVREQHLRRFIRLVSGASPQFCVNQEERRRRRVRRFVRHRSQRQWSGGGDDLQIPAMDRGLCKQFSEDVTLFQLVG